MALITSSAPTLPLRFNRSRREIPFDFS